MNDVVCFQETKLRKEDLDRDLAVVSGWESFFSFNRSKSGGFGGYSGVATFCRRSVTVPQHAEDGFTGVLSVARERVAKWNPPPPWEGFSGDALLTLDCEGRCVVTDHGAFVLFNVYGPAITNEGNAEERFRYKLDFYQALELRVRQLLDAGRAVLIVGDLNISPHPIDSCDPGPLPEFASRRDRRWLRALLAEEGGPFVDVFRLFHPDRKEAYTCWSTASGARVNNYGSRIDHILAGCSQRVEDGGLHAGLPAAAAWVLNADIWPELEGSDHAPVYADIQFPQPLLPNAAAPPLSTTYMFSGRQVSLKSWLARPGAPLPAPADAAATSASGFTAQQQQDGACLTGGNSNDRQAQQDASQAATAATSAAQQPAASRSPQPGGSTAQHALLRPGSTAHVAASSSQQPAPTSKRKTGTGRGTASVPAQRSLLSFFGRGSREAAGNTQPHGGRDAVGNAPAHCRQEQTQTGLSSSAKDQPVCPASVSGDSAEAHQARSRPPCSAECSSSCQDLGGECIHQSTAQQEQPSRPPAELSIAAGHGPMACAYPQTAGQPPPSSSVTQLYSAGLSIDIAVPRDATGMGSLHPAGQQPEVQPCSDTNPATQDQIATYGAAMPAVHGSTTDQAEVHGSGAQEATWSAEHNLRATAPAQCERGPVVSTAEHDPLNGGSLARNPAEHSQQGSEQEAEPPSTAPAWGAWQRIQDRMRAPKCSGHDEECVVRVVKKKGSNNGRVFFVCRRPDGAPPVGRCDFFMWANRREYRGQPQEPVGVKKRKL